jgi:hypothetical protein
MYFPWMWIFFGGFFWMLMIRPRRLWACQGRGFTDERRGFDDEPRGPLDRPSRRPRRADLESELARRDALIAKLEERVRVLERIATDDSARLRAEIDALRDPPPGSSG